jgi:aryl-alcohol dehydrogenase-like predicted oxidoreductase
VTSTILGPRTLEQFESLLPAADTTLSKEVLDRIDQLVPPGTVLNALHDVPDGTLLRRSQGS